MRCYITCTSFGFIATDDDNDIVAYELFDDDIKALENMENNHVLAEEERLIKSVTEEYDEIVIETAKAKSFYTGIQNYESLVFEETTVNGIFIREHFDEFMDKLCPDENITDKLSSLYQSVADDKIRESVKMNDVMIVETMNSLEEIEETTGKLIERLRQWCTPYVPELDKIRSPELYARLISQETTRENIKKSPLLENTRISLSDTYDIEINKNDLGIIKEYASSLTRLYETRGKLEEYVEEKMSEMAPNLNSVAGSNLGAKLIAHTNGLENLAKLPSSTIQIIGAEKAIFRHLKTGENPPKHGLIYQHPHLRGSNWWHKGKIARAIAGKIAIAARKDAYGGDYDENLRTELDSKVEEIKKQYPFPERKNKKKVEKDKKSRKKRKQKRNKKKLKKGEYTY